MTCARCCPPHARSGKRSALKKKLPERDFAGVNRYLFDNGQGGSGERFDWNLLPEAVIACVGGGSNAIGMFTDFIEETPVRLIGVEPAGLGIESGQHGAPLKHGRVGIYFGMKSPMMQTSDG